jgi:hypothetical protein
VLIATGGILAGVVGTADASGNTTLNTSLFTSGTQPGAWSVVGTTTSNIIGADSSHNEATTTTGGASNNGQITYPCLTYAPSSGSTSIPNCDLPTSFAVTGVAGGAAQDYQDDESTPAGTLRLTTDAQSEVGAVFFSTSFPTTDGLDLQFESYQWSTSKNPNQPGADGIGFALAAANPADPTPPTSPGPPGGDLGYSSDYQGYNDGNITANGTGSSFANSGLPNGYLGIGVDVFGNYANPDYQGQNCSLTSIGNTAATKYPDEVSVKGPGEGTSGYCLLDSSTESSGTTVTSTGANGTGTVLSPSGLGSTFLLDNAAATNDVPSSRPQPVKTEVLLNTSGASETMSLCPSDSVASGSFGVCTLPLNASGHTTASTTNQIFITDTLPNATSTIGALHPTWLGSNGVPKQLEFGWTASTGSNSEIHEVNNFVATTANGQIPLLNVTNTDTAGGSSATPSTGTYTNGAHPTFTLTPSVLSTNNGGNEADPITMTDVFPAGVSLTGAIVSSATDAAGNSWSCGVSGQTLTCTISPTSESGGVFTAGTSLPVVNVYNPTITASSGTLTSDAVISSSDGLPADANDSGTVPTGAGTSAPTTTTVTNSPVTPGVTQNVTYTANVVPSSGSPTDVDGGFVTFSANGAVVSGCTDVPVVISGGTSTAQCAALTYNTVGTQPTVTATYTGDATYSGSVGTDTVTTVQIPTSTAVTPTSTPTLNTPVTYSAVVTPSIGTTVDGGTVNFYNGAVNPSNKLACSPVTVATVAGVSTATCSTTVTYNSTGTQNPINAVYAGDTDYSGSTGTYTPSISAATPTRTVVTPSPSSPTLGSPVTYTATVTPTSGSSTSVDGGTVAFTNGGTALACNPVTVTTTAGVSTATCVTTVTYNTPGTQSQIQAVYSGDTSYGGSTGNYTPDIGNIATTTAVVPSTNPPTLNNAVTYTATVTPATGTTVDGGTVSFTSNGAALACNPVTVTTVSGKSVASCTTPVTYTTSGVEPIVTATYSGDTNYTSSTGNYTPDIMAAQATPSSAPVGTSVSLTATGLPTTATGTITFTSNGTKLCSYTLGSATSCPTSTSLPSGTYPVTATYSGDANDPAQTATTTFTLTPATPGTPSGPTAKTYKLTYSGPIPTPTGTGPFTYTITSQPPTSDGYCSISATGVVTFDRAAGFSGKVECPYEVTGSNGKVAETGTYDITAYPIVDGTVAYTPKDVPITVANPRATGTGPFTYKILSGPPASDGSFTFSPNGQITFDPAKNFTGPVNFTFEVRDGHGLYSKPAVTTIDVGSAGITIPDAHTGEPWANSAYWVIVSSFVIVGTGLALSRTRREQT